MKAENGTAVSKSQWVSRKQDPCWIMILFSAFSYSLTNLIKTFDQMSPIIELLADYLTRICHANYSLAVTTLHRPSRKGRKVIANLAMGRIESLSEWSTDYASLFESFYLTSSNRSN